MEFDRSSTPDVSSSSSSKAGVYAGRIQATGSRVGLQVRVQDVEVVLRLVEIKGACTQNLKLVRYVGFYRECFAFEHMMRPLSKGKCGAINTSIGRRVWVVLIVCCLHLLRTQSVVQINTTSIFSSSHYF